MATVRPSNVRMDPRYPPQSFDDSPIFEDLSSPQDNGLNGTGSRRRRVSGQGYTKILGNDVMMPAAPDAPNPPPPVSYRNPHAHGGQAPVQQPAFRSFAARARAIPDEAASVLPNVAQPKPEPVRRESGRVRRGSINRSSGPVYPNDNQSSRAAVLPNAEMDSPQQSSTSTVTPRHYKASELDSAQRNSPVEPPPRRTAVSPQIRSNSRRVSADTADLGTDWAADRSPLQKLEVKLNDISKEEKRARVQEAEQLLRESKARKGSAHGSSDIGRQMARASSQYSEPISVSKRRQSRDQPVSQTKGPSGDILEQQRSREPEVNAMDPRGTQRKDRAFPSPTTQNQGINIPPGAVLGTVTRTPSKKRRSVDINPSNREEGRGVRFQNENLDEPGSGSKMYHDTEPASMEREPRQTLASDMSQSYSLKGRDHSQSTKNSSQPRQVPEQQKNLYSSRKQPSGPKDEATTYGGLPDPTPGHEVRSSEHGLKYEVPPQTASGIAAREQIGFGSRHVANSEATGHRKHHVSEFLHRGSHEPSPLPTSEPRRHLDEWKQGGIARLTLADRITNKSTSINSKAWWEADRSTSRRKSSGARYEQGTHSLDGGYDESNGKLKTRSFTLKSILLGRKKPPPALRARQYIGYEGTLRVRRRRRSLLRRPGSIIRLRQAMACKHESSSPSTNVSSHLSGNLLYLRHHLKQHENRELTKLMRSARITVPIVPTSFNPPLYLKCGPLLRYTGLKRDRVEQPNSQGPPSTLERETWRGSVMIVTADGDSSYSPVPTLRLFHQPMDLLPPPPQQLEGGDGNDLPSEYVDPIAGLPKLTRTGKTVYVKPVEDLEGDQDVSQIEDDDGIFEETRTANVPTSYGKANEMLGVNVTSPLTDRKDNRSRQAGRYQEVRGVRLHAERNLTFWRFNLEVELGDSQARVAYSINRAASVGFWVPARGQTMNMMFHSCNGFSMSVDSANFSGPDPLWRDVLNAHQTRPFHVMIGGGDQIYNDKVMRETTLFQEWLGIKNPLRKHEAEFSTQMQNELEQFYLNRYAMWFSQGLFGMANSQIPMINMWDDHDIIDGFGSYPHHFMSTPVFCGLGNVAFKYYMLFQHQSVVDEGPADEPSWLLGAAPGPYINEYSRSIFMHLGKHVAFIGLDCRTERMREEILSQHSYEAIFDRCDREIIRGETKHLIVLLGVPIAYPRLVWLENILTSRLMDPVKALGRTGIFGGFLNQFDGGVEILDDLDDHWTARNHKEERNWFVQELQELAAKKSVRITILGGDVHLAAIGQFYSSPKLKIKKDRDHRYMPNVISSAIVNTPPPEMMGDILNKRNKVHHLDHETDEDMIPMFTHDVDGKPRNNKRLLPRRNWCSIREYHPGTTPPPTPPESTAGSPEHSPPASRPNRIQRTLSLSRADIKPGQLFRRLSQRGPPQTPESYDDSPTDGYFPPESPRNSPPGISNGNGNGPIRNVSAPLPIRPINQFHRRPTNMSEKAADKGGADKILDLPGHVNLENGLDIVLNCEVSQHDPAGITAPYRLLVPALWYDQPVEDLDDDVISQEERKESWMAKLKRNGSIKAKSFGLARNQGKGNWGGSETDSEKMSQTDDHWEIQKRAVHVPEAARQGRMTQGQSQSQPQVQSKPQLLAGGQQRPAKDYDTMPFPSRQTSIRGQQPVNFPTRQANISGQEPLTIPARQERARNNSQGTRSYVEDGDQQYHLRRSVDEAFNGKAGKLSGSEFGGGGGPPNSTEEESGLNYSGIEAYKEKEKGWRRFLP